MLWLFVVSLPARADFDSAIRAYDAGDYATAFKEWARLAEQGDVAAMRNVGHLYRFGQGTEKNLAKAAEWYRRAAEAGLDRAQANLAALYLTGEGVPQDYTEAAKWFERAARHGLPVAEYNLGLLYEHGFGVEKSDPKALGWYNLAARGGEPHALEKLSELVQRAPQISLDNVSREGPSAEPVKAGTDAPAAVAARTPSLPDAAKPRPSDEGGVFGFLGGIFGDHDEPRDKAPPAAPASNSSPPKPAAVAAPLPPPSPSTAAAAPTSDGDSLGDGVLHVLGSVFSTNPKAGRAIDDDPAATPRDGRP